MHSLFALRQDDSFAFTAYKYSTLVGWPRAQTPLLFNIKSQEKPQLVPPTNVAHFVKTATPKRSGTFAGRAENGA